MAGVASFKPGFGAALRKLDLERVRLAFDSDWRSKSPVREALGKLGALLQGAGLQVSLLDWEASGGKGLDDLFVKEAA